MNSLSNHESLSRNGSRSAPKNVSYHDAYTYALRVAYLHHLLQPRPKKKQYIAPPKPLSKKSATIGELISDFSIVKDSKSAKLPHGFMSPLEKRMQGVVVGTERLPGYSDAAVRRTFAEAYTAFSDPGFGRRMDKERRVEDLVLIFYSNTTKALQKGKEPDDDSWRPLVDRHVALFVRLISTILKDLDKDKDKFELMTRLASLEKKLLTNDRDLYEAASDQGGGTSIEVTVPISYDVKDMPLVQVVAHIFGLKNSQVQSDIDAHRKIWTEEAALADLKSYQHCLNSGAKRTLTSDDFDVEEGFQTWKKAEAPDLSTMMLEILQAKPSLAKSTSSNKPLPGVRTSMVGVDDITSSELSKLDTNQSQGFDQAPDLSGLTLTDDQPGRLFLEEATYTFIPPDPRAFYRSVLMHAMTYDQLHGTQPPASGSTALLSKQSQDLMHELAIRWRVPQISRLVLFLDVVVQKFLDQEVGRDELETAFEFLKDPPPEPKHKHGHHSRPPSLSSFDPSLWPVKDFTLYRQLLSSLYDALLRDLYDLVQHCYESKPPSPAQILHILQNHIYNDSAFTESPEQYEAFVEQLAEGLRQKAAEVYRGYIETEIPEKQEEWQFYHVVQLGKSVVKLCDRIQKRYRKNPEIMGVNPLTVLVETMFPSFENDAGELIKRILDVAQANQSEVAVQDGFDLYRELVEIRRIHHSVLPNQQFAFHIEGLLADFVWRWIRTTDSRMIELVDEAIKQDQFQVRCNDPGRMPTDDERHSVSIIDIFGLFNQTADQVFQLEWDDDVHHAQFMTALSKSFGAGLEEYCHIVEQRFAREMDRLSPAQEAAASQTKQEKWMQLAKDIWNSKEKVEPFQFYPEVISHFP